MFQDKRLSAPRIDAYEEKEREINALKKELQNLLFTETTIQKDQLTARTNTDRIISIRRGFSAKMNAITQKYADLDREVRRRKLSAFDPYYEYNRIQRPQTLRESMSRVNPLFITQLEEFSLTERIKKLRVEEVRPFNRLSNR